jgi:type I restriction enzyme S subunit
MIRGAFKFPADWQPDVLSAMAHIVPGKTPAKADYRSAGDIKVIKYRDVAEGGGVDFSNDEEGWIDSSQTERNDFVTLRPETILLTNAAHSVSHIGKKIGYVEALPHATPTCFVGELTSMRAKSADVNTRWLYYLLQTEPLRREIAKAAEGAHLVPYWLKRVPLARPNEPEQTRIAETLKAADDHIHALDEQIRNAERVKNALLQSLFVVGLPGGNFPTVDSNIGPVPSHWVFQRLGKTFREPPFNGVSPESRPNPPGTPILNVSCVNDGLCTADSVTYVDVDEAIIRANSAEKGDFFALRGNGNRDYVGTGGWLRVTPPKNCIFSDKLIRLRFDTNRVVEGFYPYLWQSRAFQIRLQSKAQSSSGLWMMNKRDIAREWVALPPKDEQTQMVEILDSASENLAALQGQFTAARRVKQSLLQNLLTGKLRLKP